MDTGASKKKSLAKTCQLTIPIGTVMKTFSVTNLIDILEDQHILKVNRL
jgi:hypothetical protein